MHPPASQLVFSRQAIRELDRRSIEEYAIPGIVLMENAAYGLALRAMNMLNLGGMALSASPCSRGREHGTRILIVCGGGNNGGDGLAAARHLHNRGFAVTVILTRTPKSYTGDAATNLKIAQQMKLDLIDGSADPTAALKAAPRGDLILDGLLGTGLCDPVRPPLTDVIRWMNSQGAPVLAIDIPSGLDCDTGVPLGQAVRAIETVTFVGWKRGFLNPDSRNYTGNITVVEIGAPRELAQELGDKR